MKHRLISAPHRLVPTLAASAFALLACLPSHAQETERKTIPVSTLSRAQPVDFDREILPVLKQNCLACHNKTSAKADLLLESPADLLKGGESGPAVIPGKAAESLLLKVATHEAKPRMPPRENKVNAVDLTPDQLGLLALWINQGARASDKREEIISWQKLAPAIQSIQSVAITDDGALAACGRANQIHLYDLRLGKLLSQPSDPSLKSEAGEGAAHRDLVNALALSSDGQWLASGGFREVKIWKRQPENLGPIPPSASSPTPAPSPQTPGPIPSPDSKFVAFLSANGAAFLSDKETNRFLAQLDTHWPLRAAHSKSLRAAALAKTELTFRSNHFEAARKELQSQIDRLKKAVDILRTNQSTLDEKQRIARKHQLARDLAQMRFDRENSRLAGKKDAEKDADAAFKDAKEKLAAASKTADESEGQRKTAAQKLSQTQNERDLAQRGIRLADAQTASTEFTLRHARASEAEARLALARAEALLTNPPPAITRLQFSPDSTRLAAVTSDGQVHLWNPSAAEPLSSLNTGASPATDAQFLSPTELAVTLKSGPTHRFSLEPHWALHKTLGKEIGESPFPDRVTSLAFRPDAVILATGSGEPTRSGEIRLWNVADGALRHTFTNLHSDAVLALSYSPDGWQLASGGADRFARIVDTALPRLIRSLEGHSGHVMGVAWAPHGRTLASAGADNVVKFWDMISGEKRKQITGLGKEVTAVAYTGIDQVVSVSGQPLVRFANENGDKIRDLEGAADFLTAGASTPDGETIVAGGADGILHVWRNPSAKPSVSFKPPQR